MSKSAAVVYCAGVMTTNGARNADGATGYRGLISSAVASHAKTSVPLDEEPGFTENNRDSGPSSIGSFANFDLGTSSWRTAQTSWLTDSGWTSLSGAWPQSGMTRNGTAFLLPPLVPRMNASGSSLWPTLDRPNGGRGIPKGSTLKGRTITVTDRKTGKARKVQLSLKNALKLFPTLTSEDASGRGYQYQGSRDKAALTLSGHVRMLPTLIKRDRRSFLGAQRSPNSLGSEPLTVALGGALNPRWCEWFMGFPDHWCADVKVTAARSVRSATRSRRSSRNGSAGA